jgi:hypothetical protein
LEERFVNKLGKLLDIPNNLALKVSQICKRRSNQRGLTGAKNLGTKRNNEKDNKIVARNNK